MPHRRGRVGAIGWSTAVKSIVAIVASPLLAFLIAVLAMWSVRLVQRRF